MEDEEAGARWRMTAGRAAVVVSRDADDRQHLGRPVTRTFPGRSEQVAHARRFVNEVLGPVPVLDEVVLLVSELCTNALAHTASGDGGTFGVTVHAGPSSVWVEVRDEGSDRTPVPGEPGPAAEAGRGLSLVELLADWGYFGDHNGRSVFFEIGWQAPG